PARRRAIAWPRRHAGDRGRHRIVEPRSQGDRPRARAALVDPAPADRAAREAPRQRTTRQRRIGLERCRRRGHSEPTLAKELMLTTYRIAVALAVLAAAVRTPAQAQPASAQAEALFRQGKDLLAKGQIAEACAAFDASQKLAPTAATLLNQA